MSNEILVYLETNNSGILDYSLDLITGAKEISNGMKVSGAVILPDGVKLNENIKNNIKNYGLDKLYILQSGLKPLDRRLDAKLILELVKKIAPDIILFISSSAGREIAPVIASTLNTGLTADCTKLEIIKKDDKNHLVSTRPTFGGKLMASILCKTTPEMATVRKNTFKKKIINEAGVLEVEYFEPNQPISPMYEILKLIETSENDFLNISNAKIILTGGLGLKNKENFDKLKYLGSLIGAKTGGTRKAVDKGFIEREFQIGQTGNCTAPELYIAFGVSGAIHHIVGCENSKKIIAINTDKNAPIFKSADMGLIKDAPTVLDELTEYFEVYNLNNK